MEGDFQEFFEWCQRNKVPVVNAAGNAPEEFLDQKVPHKFGTETNTIITVGGVNKDGTLFRHTTPPRPNHPESMTVFAPAEDIIVPAAGAPPGTDQETSQAAAVVVSLPRNVFNFQAECLITSGTPEFPMGHHKD
jgi:hypothetical protein